MTSPIMAADLDNKLGEFAELVYESIAEKDAEKAQDSLYMIAKAIGDELEPSMAEEGDSEAEPEVGVQAEEVEQSATTPLDVFNMKVKSVLFSDEFDRRGKLQASQDALAEVGAWIQQSVIQETPPSMGDIREVIVAAVEEGTKDLVQKNAAQQARIEELEKMILGLQGQQVVTAPTRKSIFKSEGTSEPPKDKFTAKEVAQMTLPPGMIY